MTESANEPATAEAPAPVHEPRIQIVVTDARVIVRSHCWHAPTCVSITAAIQTLGRVCAYQGLLAAPLEKTVGENPMFDVRLRDCHEARAAIGGFMDAAVGAARMIPETILMSDNRREPATLPELAPDGEPTDAPMVEAGTGGYAETLETPRLHIAR